MIELRRAQLSFGDGLIAGEVGDLREDWMEHADRVLADERMVEAVYEAPAGRPGGLALPAAVDQPAQNQDFCAGK